MNSGVPSLYLDPLLPLALRVNPHSIPAVAGSTPARALLVAHTGVYRVPGAQAHSAPERAVEVRAPGILWLTTMTELAVRYRHVDDEGDGPRPRLSQAERRGTVPQGAPGPPAPSGWLLVIGQRLLDQLVVGAFGEPGFSRFLEGFSTSGSTPSGRFLDDLAPLLESLERELDQRPPAYRVRARSLLTNVMLSLYRSALTAEPEATGGFRVAAVIDHIELNYDDHLDLESLAAMMQTSPTHLSRVFRREAGMPLFEYINRTRIRKACALLRRTGLPVTRIAIDVGYNNVSFFNRYFRRIMRCSPSEYRRSVTE